MSIPEEARLMGEQGLPVMPIGPGTKYPPIKRWPEEATSKAEVHREWWIPHPEWGVGWKMGVQDDGRFLVAIDVDLGKGGKETLAEMFEADPRLKEEFAATCRAVTGSGGAHFVFELPPDVPRPDNRARLRPGIDIRAEAGQIVVQPSIHPETGKMYRWVPGHEPWVIRPAVAGPATLALLGAPSSPPPLRVVPEHSVFDDLHVGESPGDWVRRTQDFSTYLLKHGWEHVRQESWRRPDKTDRGTSAELKGDGQGPLNIFTTDVPEALAALGKPDATGQCISVSLFDFIAAYEYDGDRSACGSAVRRRMNAEVGAVAGRAAPEPPSVEATTASRLPTLPEEFWAHPVNAHILAAARARRCGPDALVLNVLLRAAILIPPSLQLPPLSGGFSPINLLGCVVGRTGEGKSVSIAAAADLLSADHPWLLWDMPLGSGEGVGDVFMMDEVEEDEKGRKRRTGRRVQNPNLHAVHFTVDEGAALVEQSTRKGATIIPALCKAWTGVTLGETNADVATRRRVRALSYRVAAVVNIQPTNFHRLFNTANTGTGLTGRFLFAPAADYDMPDERGPWPGTLEFPSVHGGQFGHELSYHPDIYAEVDAAIVAANRGGGTPENVSHANLLRARIAAIYALWDERRTISPTDWYTAGLLTQTSASTLQALDSLAQSRQRDERHSTAVARAEIELVVEDRLERQGIARMAEAIRRKVINGSVPRAEVRKGVSAGSTRHRFEDALALAIANGWVRVEEHRIEPV